MTNPTPYPRSRTRITLLENIHPAARETLEEAGFAVEVIPRALDHEELNAAIASSHVLGVRSRTKIRAPQFEHARQLLAIGCFSVGTDQVAIGDAAEAGVPVFNAPHASTRSVAELTLGNIVALARRLGDKNLKLHRGEWDKSLAGAHEVRGRSLGIVGYGHIGQQVGILAEAFGMRVIFFDIQKKLSLGSARAVASLEALLADDLELQVLLEVGEWAAAGADRDRDRRQLELVDEAQTRQRLSEVGAAVDQDRPFVVPGLQVRDACAQVPAEDFGRSPRRPFEGVGEDGLRLVVHRRRDRPRRRGPVRAHDLVAAAAHHVNAGLLERPEVSLARLVVEPFEHPVMGPVERRGKAVEGQDHLENDFSFAHDTLALSRGRIACGRFRVR